jgi:hypothetical protein
LLKSLTDLLKKSDERTARTYFVVGILPILAGISGSYYDLTYHILNTVDSFFQPAHLIIYSSIFGALIIGIVITIKTGFKSLMIASAILLSFGYGDLLFHNSFGFDSFLSPPHLALISTAIIQAGIMLRKFIQLDHKLGSVISLATLWLATTYLLLAFSFVSNRSSETSYHVVAPQEIVFMVTAFFFPALSVLVARFASLANVKMLHVALVFASAVSIGGILTNPNITYTLPLFLVGILIPSFAYDKMHNKLPRFSAVILGASWILTYTPYAYKLISYSVAKMVVSLNDTYMLIPALAQYYPIMILLGVISGVITSYFLTENRVASLVRLPKLEMEASKATNVQASKNPQFEKRF